MSNLQAYDPDPNSNWFNNISLDTSLDFFFTQRKIIEYDEIVNTKTLDRNKTKKNIIQNFLAITFPNNQFKNKLNIFIEIEIWGDSKYKYKGNLTNIFGESPNILLKLEDDKELFVKLIYYEKINNELKEIKTFTKFIPIIKRYQSIPQKD